MGGKVGLAVETPALDSAIRCVLIEVARAVDTPLRDLPGKFNPGQTATILGLTTPRTLDTWASRADHGGLPFLKIGRARFYLLTDIVLFVVSRHSNLQKCVDNVVASAVGREIERLEHEQG